MIGAPAKPKTAEGLPYQALIASLLHKYAPMAEKDLYKAIQRTDSDGSSAAEE